MLSHVADKNTEAWKRRMSYQQEQWLNPANSGSRVCLLPHSCYVAVAGPQVRGVHNRDLENTGNNGKDECFLFFSKCSAPGSEGPPVKKHEQLHIPATINLALKQHGSCLLFFKATANPPSAGDTDQEIGCRAGLKTG